MNATSVSTQGEPQRLAVDLPYAELVEEVLRDLGLCTSSRPHAGIGLTLIDPHLGDEPLDPLLAEVRRRLSACHGGWTPQIGKDRTASSTIITGGHTRPMANGLIPEPDSPPMGSLAAFSVPSGRAGARIGLVDVPKAENLQLATGQSMPAWKAHSAFILDLIAQVAPDIPEPVVRGALDEDGGKGDLWEVATAMVDLVLDDRVDILLLPLACYTADGLPPLLMTRAIERIADKALIIAAAGNQLAQTGWLLGRCPTSSAWPGAFPQVQAVAGDFFGGGEAETRPPWLDALTAESRFSGAFFNGTVELEGRYDTQFSGHAVWAGTSFCAAHAAGLVASRVDAHTSARQAWQALLDEGHGLRRPSES